MLQMKLPITKPKKRSQTKSLQVLTSHYMLIIYMSIIKKHTMTHMVIKFIYNFDPRKTKQKKKPSVI